MTPEPPAEQDVTVEDLGPLVDRALRFEDVVLRRAWGIYYAIWAVALLVFVLTGPLLSLWTGLSSLADTGIIVALVSAAGLAAGVSTGRIFARARRVLRLRAASRGCAEKDRRPQPQALPLGVALLPLLGAVALLAAGLWRPGYVVEDLTLLDLALVPVDLFILQQMRRSFAHLPPEARLAVGAYGASIAVSLAGTLATANPWVFTAVWLVVGVAGWFFCSLYALYHASESFVEAAG